MSIQMYMVGGVLFAIYIYFTIWNIFRNNKAQQPRKNLSPAFKTTRTKVEWAVNKDQSKE